jgi:hypothetical protein
MNKRKLVVEVEHFLGSLAGETALEVQRHSPLIEVAYVIMRRRIEAAKVPLDELGMYVPIVAAVDQAEALLRDGQGEVGSELLFDMFQELMRKSGTSERYGRRYGKKADGSEPRMPEVGKLIEGCGDPAPDAYRGHFAQMAPAQDQAAVGAVENALALLRSEVMLASAGVGADVPGHFGALREKAAKAEQALGALGLYRLLLDTLAAAESFAGEGEHTEADELLDELERHLRQRVRMNAGR